MPRPIRRNDTTPALADLDLNTVELLTPIPIRERAVSEGWLQALIFANPSMLPTGKIRADAGHLIPIGREVGVQSGRIDCLYISPEGTHTLVETKLWANSEARRQVIAQIIQYAEELSGWTYEDLDQTTVAYTGKRLWDLVAPEAEKLGSTEQAFEDTVSQKLERADFLLLIVGDGIQHSVEKMAAFLEHPQLHYTLALIELQLFRQPGDERLLIMPSVVARVQEVERAVVRVKYRHERPEVDVDLDEPDEDASGRKRGQPLTEEEYLELIRTDERTTPQGLAVFERLYEFFNQHPRLNWRYGNDSAVVAYPKRNSKLREISLLTIGPFGIVKFHTGACNKALTKRFGEEEAARIHRPYEQALRTIFGTDVTWAEISVYIGDSHLSKAHGSVDALLNAIGSIARDIDALELAAAEA